MFKLLTSAVFVAASLPLSLAPANAHSQSTANEGETTAPFVTMRDGTRIFYKDWGAKTAKPIVFHHGWPLSADDWDN